MNQTCLHELASMLRHSGLPYSEGSIFNVWLRYLPGESKLDTPNIILGTPLKIREAGPNRLPGAVALPPILNGEPPRRATPNSQTFPTGLDTTCPMFGFSPKLLF